MTHRVVITGMGIASPIGHDLGAVSEALREGRHGIVQKPEWNQVACLETRLAGEVRGLALDAWPRKKVRSMGRVARLATYATERAVADAGLDEAVLASGRVGLAYGSTQGSAAEFERFCETFYEERGIRGFTSTGYLKFMSHTCAANLALFYGIRGRVLPTCSACTSGSQAIGAAYEAVRHGLEEVMLAGGAEEMHFMQAGVFDTMYATSTRYNDAPDESPRPFDAARDGLVVGEGAATLVLEPLERARARGAHIHGEVLGYGASCDGTHVTAPSVEGMAEAMRRALDSARLSNQDLDYINAHATGTRLGDVCESRATSLVIGDRIPISSTKGHVGHTLGACGAHEAVFVLTMMRDGFIPATRNLTDPDPECAPLCYIMGDARDMRLERVMSNNFAFGGINTSLIFGRV